MRYSIALALICLPLAGQAPLACSAQLVPLKPLSLASCPLAAPSCVTSANGMQGRWIWGCPINSGASPTTPIQPIPIQQWNSPQVQMPLDTARQAEELRQLRLQNQALENSLSVFPAITHTMPPQAQPVPLNQLSQPNNESLPKTDGYINGRAWQLLPDAEKAGYLLGLGDGMDWIVRNLDPDLRDFYKELIPGGLIVNEVEAAVDHFYTEPPNLSIPVVRAVHIVALKSIGISPDEIQKEVALERQLAADSDK